MRTGTIVGLWVVVGGALLSGGAIGADPTASLDAPATATAGSHVAVRWTGPGDGLDRIAAVPAGSPDDTVPQGLPCYPGGSEGAELRPAYVKVPEQPGEY